MSVVAFQLNWKVWIMFHVGSCCRWAKRREYICCCKTLFMKVVSVLEMTYSCRQNDNATPTGTGNSNKHKVCNHNDIVWETSEGNCNVSDRHVEWDPQCKSYPHKRKENNVLICSALNLAAVLNLIMQSNVLEKTALHFSKSLHGSKWNFVSAPLSTSTAFLHGKAERNQGCFVGFGLFTL